MSVNDIQVGGEHYRAKTQHWDFVEVNGMGYLEGYATKYVTRRRKKNGHEDLRKALHCVDKLIELFRAGVKKPRTARTVISVEQFAQDNALDVAETRVIDLLTHWCREVDLEKARVKIQHMLNHPTEG